MIRHFILFSASLVLLTSSSFFVDTKCEDDPTAHCENFKDKCTDDDFIPLLRRSCPITCHLCPTTVSPSTAGPCVDSPGTDCKSFKDYCSNSKYVPMLKEFCPVTCNMCPGATTVAAPTPDPNCHDNESACAAWKAHGYCTNNFYTCAQKIRMCAKTCGYCTKGSCKN